MSKAASIFCFLFSVFASGVVEAQPDLLEQAEWPNRVHQALPTNEPVIPTVRDVCTDSEGTIWYLADNHLRQFYGERSISSGLDALKDDSGIDRPVYRVVADPLGELIAALTPAGIAVADIPRKSERWIPFEDDLAPVNREQCLLTISAENHVWLWSGESLLHFDSNGTKQIVDLPPKIVSLRAILACRSTPGVLWATSKMGALFCRDPESKEWNKVHTDIGYGGKGLFSIAQDEGGHIYTGCRNGFLLHDPSTGITEHHGFKDPRQAVTYLVTGFAFTRDNSRVWLATRRGRSPVLWDCETKKFQFFPTTLRFYHTRVGFDCNGVAIGKCGAVFFATDRNGLAFTDSHQFDIEIFPFREDGSGPVPIGNVSRVVSDQVKLYVATDRGSVEIDRDTQNSRPFPSSPAGSNDWARDLHLDDDGTLFALTERYLLQRDTSGDIESPWQIVREFSDRRIITSHFSETRDADERIWFTRDRLVYRFDPGSGEIEEITRLPRLGGAIACSKEFVYASSDNKILTIPSREPFKIKAVAVSDAKIRTIHPGSDGRLWVGTDGGLFSREKGSREFALVTSCRRPVDSVFEDSSGKLWLVGNRVLTLLDSESKSRIPLPSQDWFDLHREYLLHLFPDITGKIIACGWGRLALANPESILEDPIQRQCDLKATSLQILLKKESPIELHLNDLSPLMAPIKFGPDGEAILLETSVVDYRDPEANRIEYRLGDEEWRLAPHGLIELSHLRAGLHRLDIRGFGSFGREASNSLRFDIASTPPFHETPWFVVMVVLAIFGAGAAFQSYRGFLQRKSRILIEEADERVKRSERRFRDVFETSSDALVITDTNGTIVEVNPAAVELFGIESKWSSIGGPIADLVGKGYESLSSPETSSGHAPRPLRIETRDSRIIHALHSVSGQKGGRSHLQHQFRDVTRQAQLESQVQQAQRMEAVGTLAGGIAHDFNNLLSPILVHSRIAATDLSEKGAEAIPDVTESIRICEQAATRAAGLVGDLLHFARKDDEGIDTIDLAATARGAIRLLRGSIPSHIQVSVDFPNDPCWVDCSAQRLEQVIMNLGMNASHAIGIEAGTMNFQLSRGENDEAKSWIFTVRDSGCGMTPETARRAFDPFFTTKEVGEGTGLGLAMVHAFVSEAGGKISVESELGEGATFRLSLPSSAQPEWKRVADKIEVSEPSFSHRNRDSNERFRILVVDDEPLVLKTTGLLLGRQGYDVTSFDHPDSALESFREDPDRYDLLVTDQMMPGTTGLDLAGKFRAIRAEFPIILLTGFSETLLEKDPAVRIVDAVHMKPLDYSALDKTIQTLRERGESAGVALPS